VSLKEKFGELRVYMDGKATGDIYAVIRNARDSSLKICDVCGASGQLRRVHWYFERTRCPAHC